MQQRSCYTQSIHKARIQCKGDNEKMDNNTIFSVKMTLQNR